MDDVLTSIGCRVSDRERIKELPFIGKLKQPQAIGVLVHLATIAPVDLLMRAFREQFENGELHPVPSGTDSETKGGGESDG